MSLIMGEKPIRKVLDVRVFREETGMKCVTKIKGDISPKEIKATIESLESTIVRLATIGLVKTL